MGDELRIRLLGPVSVETGRRTVVVRSRPQRIVLACLALDANRVVSTTTLLDALWNGEPPTNAVGNLHSYVSKLRALVGPDRIRRAHGGYRLEIDDGAVDAWRAQQLAEAAAQLTPTQRVGVLGDALALWRGPPLADLDDVDVFLPHRTRLEAVRRDLVTRRSAAAVDAGRSADVLADLHQAAIDHPHDEAVVALLARALHEAGRTAEALRTIAAFRRRIVEDTGLSAGTEIGRLETLLLADDDTAGRVPATAMAAEWPGFPTPLVGRDDILTELEGSIASRRVVTLTGSGGIGKTRLACALADRRHAAGQAVHFVALAALATDDDLAARVAAALGLHVPAGHDPLAVIHERIGSGGQLLVLDNCEHVLDAAGRLVDALLTRRSDLAVLITSRSRLGLPAEIVVRVPPLAGPDGAARRLFLERVQRVRPGFEIGPSDDEALGVVLGGLGGLPLAIELAAGRLSAMSLADLAARVGDLDLLAGGRPVERHGTLRAALDWSYRLLDDPARRLLRAMSLFPAGVDLATVDELAPDLQLDNAAAAAVALAEASLVDVDLGPSTRYRMLEPVRAFAADHLDASGEQAAGVATRARWARRTATRIEDVCRSPQEATADARLRADLVNLRAAHRAAVREGDLDVAIDISVTLTRPATARDLPEVWSWALDLASQPGLRAHDRWPDALGAAATAAWLTGDLEVGVRLATDGLRADPNSVSCLQALGSLRLFLGEPAAARELWVEASRPHGAYLPQAALAAVYTGDADLARRSLAEADAWAAAVGSPSELALCRYAWGELLGPDRAAVAEYEQAIELASEVGASFVASISRVGLASTWAANGEARRAAREFDTVVRYWRTTGNWIQQWTTLRNVAVLLDTAGRPATAARIRTADGTGAAADRGSIVALVLAELADLHRDR